MTDNSTQNTGQNAGAGDGQGAKQQTKGRIADDIIAKYPDLEKLIVETESMTDEERDYWFQILPIMTDEQIEKLRGILIHEKEQLAKLDTEYETELSKLNEKHVMEFKQQEREEKRSKLKAQEHASEQEEAAAEADLLKQLEDVDDGTGQA
tara:strand:- start:14 stop:466 length:453 start_codon:yes stop_codon:yes gene_type:complete